MTSISMPRNYFQQALSQQLRFGLGAIQGSPTCQSLVLAICHISKLMSCRCMRLTKRSIFNGGAVVPGLEWYTSIVPQLRRCPQQGKHAARHDTPLAVDENGSQSKKKVLATVSHALYA